MQSVEEQWGADWIGCGGDDVEETKTDMIRSEKSGSGGRKSSESESKRVMKNKEREREGRKGKDNNRVRREKKTEKVFKEG